MPGLDPETLERLRRGFSLRIDRTGAWWLGDDPITHPRIVALFRRGLDLSDAGEPIVRVDGQWTYLQVADCMLRAVRVVADASDAPMLVLDDARTVALDWTALCEQTGHGLRCSAPARASGRPLSVRFCNTAQMDLQPWIVWPDPRARPRLRIGGVEHVIPEC